MNSTIDSVSYDQYKNIPTTDELGVKTKVIFSQEAYLNLLTLIKRSKDSGMETGCFFVGVCFPSFGVGYGANLFLIKSLQWLSIFSNPCSLI